MDNAMLTKRDLELAEAGLVSFDRLRALQHALTERAVDARTAAQFPDTHPMAKAALQGKATAYREGADQIESLLHGNGMKKPKWAMRVRSRVRRQTTLTKTDLWIDV